MKKWWFLISFFLLFACKNQKLAMPEPVMEMENFIDIQPEEGIPVIDSSSVMPEGFIEINVNHQGMDQEKIDSIKTIKNNQKKFK